MPSFSTQSGLSGNSVGSVWAHRTMQFHAEHGKRPTLYSGHFPLRCMTNATTTAMTAMSRIGPHTPPYPPIQPCPIRHHSSCFRIGPLRRLQSAWIRCQQPMHVRSSCSSPITHRLERATSAGDKEVTMRGIGEVVCAAANEVVATAASACRWLFSRAVLRCPRHCRADEPLNGLGVNTRNSRLRSPAAVAAVSSFHRSRARPDSDGDGSLRPTTTAPARTGPSRSPRTRTRSPVLPGCSRRCPCPSAPMP